MTTDQIVYLIPYLVAASISLGVGLYAFFRRNVNGAGALGWLALLETEWTLAFIGQTIAPTLEGKLFWNNLQFIGAIFAPMAYLGFVFEYTHRRIPKHRQTFQLLLLVPAFILFLVWTDGFHGLWRIAPHLIPDNPFPILGWGDGRLFMLYPLFGYSVMLYATLVMLVNFFATPRIYRFQAGAVLAGVVFPWAITVIAVLNIVPWPLHEATPLTFAVSNGIVAWALFRFGLFNIVPVARELLVENLRDAMVVLDHRLHVVDFNHAARLIIDRPDPNVTGQDLQKVWPYLYERVKDLSNQASEQSEIELPVTGEPRWFELAISPLSASSGAPAGKLVVLRDITERKHAEAELQRLAITDPLTGVYNRRQFFELADREIERARRYHHPLSLLIFDLDDFKSINDRYGHRAGDRVLQAIAHDVASQLRDSDTIARYGGEEFIVLLPETGADRAYDAAERLRAIAAACSVDAGRGPVQVTASLGVVSVPPEENPVDLDQMLERADQALYAAKRLGRNRVCVWDAAQAPADPSGSHET